MTDRTKIEELVQQELEEANKLHPLHHTMHEAWAVALEEYEEAVEEMLSVEQHLKQAWHDGVREDDSDRFERNIWAAKNRAMKSAAECIQLAAMCQKALDSELD